MSGINSAENVRPQVTTSIPRLTSGLLLAPGMVFAIWFVASTAAAADVVIHPREHHTNEFGGRETTRSFRIESDQPLTGRFVWSLPAQERTLARGEQDVRVARKSEAVRAQFRLDWLRDEVILPLTLTVAVVVEQREVARQELRLWLFPDDPFAPRGDWLRSLDITLFDPVENTSKVFDDANISYRPVGNTAALEDAEQSGVLIIGEGASLRQHRALVDTALRAAAAGRRVILLAPADGALPIPGTHGDDVSETSVPSELRFARQQVIGELGKRLDAQAWPGTDSTIPSSRLLIESHGGRVEATVAESPRAWPWLEVRFPETDGVFLMCGFRVIEHWNNGPTPRFLLLRLLESVSLSESENPSEETD